MATAAQARLSLLLRKSRYSSESTATGGGGGGGGTLGKTAPLVGRGVASMPCLERSSMSTKTTSSATEEEEGGEVAEAEAS